MDKLRVCLANDSFPPLIDGVATAVVNYAENINRRLGYATVVTPDYPGADDSQYDFPVIRYLSIDFTKFVGYRAGVPFSAELLQRLQAEDFQIIHSHCPITSTILARILRKRADIPIVCTYHTKFDIDIAKAIRGKILQEEAVRLLVKNISACDEVWTVSEGAGKNLQALGFTGEYVVMPNGVDFPVGRCSQAQIGEVTKGFDLPSDVPVFLFVGRMMWYKGIRIILDALARLSAQGIDFRMVFIGDGKDRKEIVDYAQLLPCSGKVLFLPPIHDREHIRAWYCRADLFLFPSTFDTNGLVVREAAACGLASVLIENSCAAEGIVHNRNGFLVQENAQALADELFRLLSQMQLLHRVGECAQREIYLSWADAVARAYQRYFTVIDNYRIKRKPRPEQVPEDSSRAATLFAAIQNWLRESGRHS
ncbi:MAG TPA: glycosyltransferase [Candidatus Aphodomonas merdavium]|nr:glycosyltransferase [Candidatus Aphodomonas merdavium]